MNKREKDASQTRKKLLSAANELIKEKGIANISVEDITKKAKVAKGTFYTYFKKKEDITNAVCYTNFSNVTNEILSIDNKSLIEKVYLYMTSMLKIIEDSGIKMCRSWTSNVILGKKGNEISKYDFDVQNLELILTNGIKNKELKDNTPIHEISMLIINELYGGMMGWCIDSKEEGLVKSFSWFNQDYLHEIFKKYLEEN